MDLRRLADESSSFVPLDVEVTLVAEIDGSETVRVIGVGIEPAQGMNKGMVVDVALAADHVELAGVEDGREQVVGGGGRLGDQGGPDGFAVGLPSAQFFSDPASARSSKR